tara:strand:+ start:1175 stop:1681 length:507 start_codon:yes stop_codon:yes gene_type:complete
MIYKKEDMVDIYNQLEVIRREENHELLMGYLSDGNFMFKESFNNRHFAIEEPEVNRMIDWFVRFTITKEEIDSVNKEECSQHVVRPIFDNTIDMVKELIELKYKDHSFYYSGYPVERQMDGYSSDEDTYETFASRDFEQELQAAGVGYIKEFGYNYARGLDFLSNTNF